MTRYQFSVYTFSEQEIEQIISLVKRWAKSDIWFPIDARTLTRRVKEYAVSWDLLEKRDGRLYLTGGSKFSPRYNLPVEALWRLVLPMLRTDGVTGYSIVNNKLWEVLDIYPQNSRGASDRDLEEKIGILGELSAYQYIYLQMAGSVWSITRREESISHKSA